MNEIKQRRGIIEISGELIYEFDVSIFKAIFSVFFPIGVEKITYGFSEIYRYYGYSASFEIVDIDEPAFCVPRYDITMKRNDNNDVEIISINKI